MVVNPQGQPKTEGGAGGGKPNPQSPLLPFSDYWLLSHFTLGQLKRTYVESKLAYCHLDCQNAYAINN